MSKIVTKTVLPEGNLNDGIYQFGFYIKDYQRGYRWEEKQICDLLSDILEFNDENHTLKYCLQPLVVKPVKEKLDNVKSLANIIGGEKTFDSKVTEYWELIDGQQRLTTLWLILDCCNKARANPQALPYTICYEFTRSIDIYYLNKAKDTIEKWFKQFSLREDDQKDEIRKRIHSLVQFIWYEVSSDTNSVDIFNKINMGKIPLTNAELFKALLLNPDNIEDQEKMQNYKNLEKIALEWDKLEQSLRDDDFWYFLSNEDKDFETRIDFLLRLRAKQLKNENLISLHILETDSLFPFLALNEFIRKDSHKINNLFLFWESIVLLHDRLKAWWQDNDLYHYIGFLITAKKGNYIVDLVSKTSFKKKSEIKEIVLEDIRSLFRNVVLDDLSYTKSGDSEKIRNVLLFFNIFTMIQSKTDSKFSFKNYKDKAISWDIEHIHARATDYEIQEIKDVNTRENFLEELKAQFEELDDQKTIAEINDFITNKILTKLATGEEFLEFCCYITDKCGDFDENGLGNLTLLDSQTNRSYHNALFPIKRKKIIKRDMGEVFVPVCTKNVFLKMYSKDLNHSNMMKWTNTDALDYLNAIKKALVSEAMVCR